MSARMGLAASFSSMRIPAYKRLWWAGTCSFMSVQMQFLLRGVLAWDLTEREGALGLVYLCFGIALLIATPLGGVAADRASGEPGVVEECGKIRALRNAGRRDGVGIEIAVRALAHAPWEVHV